MPLPEAFEALLAEVVPAAELPRARASFDVASKPTSFRVNTLKVAAEDAYAELRSAGFAIERVPWLDVAMIAPDAQRRALTETRLFADGAIYVQSLSSMLAPLALGPQPNEEVLDLAAAPGGKTLMMAAMMRNEGRLAAVEPVRDRFFRLKANVERAGASVVVLYQRDGRAIGARVPERFDRVLLDAPCSSEARFSTVDPKSFAHWSPRKVSECARKQRALLQSAFAALRKGGSMIYCTCSLSPEENELAVLDLLERAPDAAIESIALPVDHAPGLTSWRGRALAAELARCARILPTESLDAFFLCAIRKAEP